MESDAIQHERLRLKKVDKKAKLGEWHPKKIALANEWIENEQTQMKRPIIRGAIFTCELGENIGTEQNGERPVLIISNDRINRTSGSVKVAPLTTKLKTKIITDRKGKTKVVPRLATHYFLKKEVYPFLAQTSAVKVEELTTVNKVRLKQHIGNINDDDLNKIMNRVKWVFDL
jgi:mRNA interferase MazF